MTCPHTHLQQGLGCASPIRWEGNPWQRGDLAVISQAAAGLARLSDKTLEGVEFHFSLHAQGAGEKNGLLHWATVWARISMAGETGLGSGQWAVGCGEGLDSGPGSGLVPRVSPMGNNNADLTALCSGTECLTRKPFEEGLLWEAGTSPPEAGCKARAVLETPDCLVGLGTRPVGPHLLGKSMKGPMPPHVLWMSCGQLRKF